MYREKRIPPRHFSKSGGMLGVVAFLVLFFLVSDVGFAGDNPVRATTNPASLSLDEVLSNVRKAIGYEQFRNHGQGNLVKCNVNRLGVDCEYTLMFTPGGEFLEKYDGPLARSRGFDGTTGWEVDWSGMPYIHESSLHIFEPYQLNVWLRTGCWLNMHADLEVSLLGKYTTNKRVLLSVKLKKGGTERWVLINRSTWLPSAFGRPGKVRSFTWDLQDYREVLGFRFPHRVNYKYLGGLDGGFYTVRSVDKAPRLKDDPYAAPAEASDDKRFDTGKSRDAEFKLAETGHLLVHPLVDGQDVGWFLIDSGASHMVIDPMVAKKLNMRNLGMFSLGLEGYIVRMDMRRGQRFEVGPMRMANPFFLEVDMKPISQFLGVELAGTCGYDLFRRAVIVLDISNATLEVCDPDTYSREDANWQEFFYVNRLICVRCKFEGGQEALFAIDTGSDKGISFKAPAVKEFKLLSDRPTTQTHYMGIVGNVVAVHSGSLTQFEIGGHCFGDLEARFAPPEADEKPYDESKPAGAIGLGLLRRFDKVIFDYPHKRIAFVKLPEVGKGPVSPFRKPTTAPNESAGASP